MSWPAGVGSRCPGQSADATVYLNQQVTIESLRVPLGPRPCSHSAECLAEGHGSETDKYRTIDGTVCSGREEPGAETAGTRRTEEAAMEPRGGWAVGDVGGGSCAARRNSPCEHVA